MNVVAWIRSVLRAPPPPPCEEACACAQAIERRASLSTQRAEVTSRVSRALAEDLSRLDAKIKNSVMNGG